MYTDQFDLDDAMTIPDNPEARQEAVIRLVSELSTVDKATDQFDLVDALTMPDNPEARRQAVICLVSEMATVDDATGDCSICFQSLSEGTPKQVSCNHVYHRQCITDWLLNGRSNTCPMCRHDI
ncbi:E3 ubiquitin-protein ligase RNF181-like [Durio zibethinus]|uniref:E3 ubiquitin-protein ligase RNF181-like n=1 Tax=Durio zibethinus TaxID=66656 RepID=A0A6P6A7A7_DURZI|nr:E3 ubiquitin-protein ligase RNF181-like [Durio zibethinus]